MPGAFVAWVAVEDGFAVFDFVAPPTIFNGLLVNAAELLLPMPKGETLLCEY